MFEGEILQFPLYLLPIQSDEQMCIDVKGFFSETKAFSGGRYSRCAYYEAVCKFHKHDTNIAHHGKQQLAIAFSLRYFMAFKDVCNFCNTVNNIATASPNSARISFNSKSVLLQHHE